MERINAAADQLAAECEAFVGKARELETPAGIVTITAQQRLNNNSLRGNTSVNVAVTFKLNGTRISRHDLAARLA